MNMYRSLTAVDYDNIRDGKFQFNLMKNIDKAEAEQKQIEKARLKLRSKPLAAFLDKHQEGIQKAVETYVEEKRAEQVKSGKQLYITDADIETVQTDYLASQDGWKDVSDDYDKFTKAVDQFLKTDNKEFKPHYIEPEYLESLPLNQTQMRPVYRYLLAKE